MDLSTKTGSAQLTPIIHAGRDADATADPLTLAAARWSARSQVWDVRVACPHCGHGHSHGGGGGSSPYGGHRVSHCLTRIGRGYHLSITATPWLVRLIDDASWLAGRLNVRSRLYANRVRAGLFALLVDDQSPAGFGRLVNRDGLPAFGLRKRDTLLALDSPAAQTIRSHCPTGGNGEAWPLYGEQELPWLRPEWAAAYRARLRAILAAVAASEGRP